MADLQQLASQKAEAALQRRVDTLPAEVQAIQRELNARGLLRSGAMLNRMLAACRAAIDAQASTVIAEYEWAVGQAIFVSQSWIERLVAEASASFSPLQSAGERHLSTASELAGRRELSARLHSDLKTTVEAARQNVGLALRSKFAERKRGLLRALPAFIPRQLARIFAAGHA